MINIKNIIEGHVNELRSLTNLTTDKEEKIFKKRAEICQACPLKTGNSCNSNKSVNPETMEVSVRNSGKEGFVNGCGCRLSAKQKSINSKCPAGFWGGEF